MHLFEARRLVCPRGGRRRVTPRMRSFVPAGKGGAPIVQDFSLISGPFYKEKSADFLVCKQALELRTSNEALVGRAGSQDLDPRAVARRSLEEKARAAAVGDA